ncbi:non-specific lipid transfer protein GPI-anchored 7-like [Cornus florida]|uniref:non-specific lipid transfer protein GPI-anchored 7-like n=1 Tax=Cornus florida TaxID=4283 RepID=UPI00289AF12D|nr:non-specific lipid transfer protein GPI-anchored 7-like [Cornus florida]
MGFLKMSALMMVVVVVAVIGFAEGQSTPSCAQKLVPCADYMNSTNPPASCCDPLKEAVTNELSCLCTLYNTPGLLTYLGINITDALALPGHCGVSGDLSACSNATAPTASTEPPPGVPGNDVSRIASTGLSSLILFWASVMLY